jgi:hypothetical protein
MRENHLLVTSTFFNSKTQNQKLKFLVWWVTTATRIKSEKQFFYKFFYISRLTYVRCRLTWT